MSLVPHEIHKDLTEYRINKVGQILASIRDANAESADKRDNGWSLGCRGHAWSIHEIVELSKGESWLNIVNPSLKFIFKIGEVEVSIYKGLPSNPNKRLLTRVQSYPEIKQLALLAHDSSIPEELIWAFAVETDIDGKSCNVEFIGMSEGGDIIASQRISINNVEGAVIVPIDSHDEGPVELAEAEVTLPKIIEVRREKENEQ